MTRVSTAEMYDDKDVITQICKLKDGLNSALGGIIADIDIVNDELVIDWADGESISLPLPSPTGISSIAGSVSGGNLTMTIYLTDGSSHAFTCPLNGMASEQYVDDGLALKADDADVVKLTGAQSIDGVKTFTDSANVPTTPTDLLGASAVNEAYVNNATDGVNNIVHKSGDENINGNKIFLQNFQKKLSNIAYSDTPASDASQGVIRVYDKNGDSYIGIGIKKTTTGKTQLYAEMRNTDGTWKYNIVIAESNS